MAAKAPPGLQGSAVRSVSRRGRRKSWNAGLPVLTPASPQERTLAWLSPRLPFRHDTEECEDMLGDRFLHKR